MHAYTRVYTITQHGVVVKRKMDQNPLSPQTGSYHPSSRYRGLSILAQLRRQVATRVAPYRMDQATLDACARWAHPLSTADERNLARLRRQPALADMRSLIDYMLLRGLKLEQEAATLWNTRS